MSVRNVSTATTGRKREREGQRRREKEGEGQRIRLNTGKNKRPSHLSNKQAIVRGCKESPRNSEYLYTSLSEEGERERERKVFVLHSVQLLSAQLYLSSQLIMKISQWACWMSCWFAVNLAAESRGTSRTCNSSTRWAAECPFLLLSRLLFFSRVLASLSPISPKQIPETERLTKWLTEWVGV